MARINTNNKIGDYVHYHYKNYEIYGIATRNSSNKRRGSGPVNAYAAQRKLLLSQAQNLIKANNKEEIRSEIESKLNYFRPGQKMPTGDWTEEDLKAIESAIQTAVINKLNGQVLVDWNTMTALNSDYLADIERTEGYNLRSKIGTKGQNDIQAVNDRLDILNRTLNETFSTVQTSTAVKLRKDLNELQQQWEAILKTAKEIGEDANVRIFQRYNKNPGGQTYTLDKRKIITHNNPKFGEDLNTLWNKFKKRIDSYTSGEIGEYYAAIAIQAAKLKGQKVTQELLDDFINYVTSMSEKQLGLVGKERSKVAFSDKNIIGGNLGNRSDHKVNGLFTDFIGGKMRLTSTQDKVDLNLELEGLDVPIAASIKNYSHIGKLGVSVHNGVSIWSLTQEYGNFMNHYLNITARAHDGQNYSAANRYLAKMNEILKLTLTLKAIAGGILKIGKNGFGPQQEAQIFILNDPSGYYHVYLIEDLIKIISKNVNKYVKMENIQPNTTWNQYWVYDNNGPNYKGAFGRIVNLLQELHEEKLHISLLPAVFANL